MAVVGGSHRVLWLVSGVVYHGGQYRGRPFSQGPLARVWCGLPRRSIQWSAVLTGSSGSCLVWSTTEVSTSWLTNAGMEWHRRTRSMNAASVNIVSHYCLSTVTHRALQTSQTTRNTLPHHVTSHHLSQNCSHLQFAFAFAVVHSLDFCSSGKMTMFQEKWRPISFNNN